MPKTTKTKKTVRTVKPIKQAAVLLDPELQWLGHRIKIARLLSGYSKSQDFKDILFPDYTISLYYQWEIGKRKPSDEAIKHISEFCKLSFDWLKTGKGDPFKGIKIPAKEKNQKKAMIGYEIAIKECEFSRQNIKISRELSEKLFTFAATAKNENKKDVSLAINIELFEKIIRELTTLYNESAVTISPKKFAKYAAQMYATIVEHEPNPNQQLKSVKIVAAAYRQLISHS